MALIDRQAAIDALVEWYGCEPSDIGAFENIIEKIPPADVQTIRHGHWIFGNTLGHSWMKCSECLVSQNVQTATYTYCPNCGALMM